MSCEFNPCYATCPATMVTIQPPPFVLSIPGPSLFCPDQPLCIEQCNPCVLTPYLEGPSRRGPKAFSGFTTTSVYSQKSQQRSASGCRRC